MFARKQQQKLDMNSIRSHTTITKLLPNKQHPKYANKHGRLIARYRGNGCIPSGVEPQYAALCNRKEASYGLNFQSLSC